MLPKGIIVNAFEDNTQLHLIKRGYIKRYLITSDGSKGIQVIFGPGDIFPLTPVYKTLYSFDVYSGPEQYYYEAMTVIDVRFLSQRALEEAVESNPLIYKDLFYAAGLRLNSYIHRLESMSLRIAKKKVAHQLAFLADTFGRKTADGIVITAPLTHQNLADILNLARETVTHSLVRLDEKKLIKNNKQITVFDIEKLRNASY